MHEMTSTASRLRQLLALAACLAGGSVQAMDWSDNAISYRVGNDFREPFNPHAIRKNIFAFTHASGYQYGGNFLNVDLLRADHNDPRSLNGDAGSSEVYVVYRHTLDIGKISGKDLTFGAVKGVGLTLGFDVNSKHDVGYNSRKRMLVLGPTLMWDVPGFLKTSLLLLHESNAPSGAFPPISTVGRRYTYDLHPMLSASWAIPVSPQWKFEGYANFIAAKGVSEVGADTGPETNIDMQMMFDAGAAMGYKKNMFRIGVEYQYWNNKFGYTSQTTSGRGYRAKTPMLRAEYHF
ncbi:MAG: outer envelope protein [Pseudomonadota bacterium]